MMMVTFGRFSESLDQKTTTYESYNGGMGNGCGFSILIKQWANIWHHFTISKVF
jgi:Na+-transporting NADH:ubiquinone oxidoreductase subunit NqrD